MTTLTTAALRAPTPAAPRARGALTFATLALVAISGCECEPELQQATGAISGKVCNPLTGAPAGGALLTIEYVSDVLGEVERKLEANADGSFTMSGIPEGTHTLHVTGDSFTNSFELEVLPSETTPLVDEGCRELAIPAGKGEIVGQICNRHVGAFVQDALIRVLLPSGEELSTTSDEQGNFILADVPAGQHTVYVSATGYSRSYLVEVKPGEQTLLEEQQRECAPPDPSVTGFIYGRICTEDEQGLAGVRVYLTSPIDGYTFEDQTAEDGSFKIAGIPAPRTVQVRAERAGFSATWNDVQVFPSADVPDGTPVDTAVSAGCSQLVPDSGVKYLVVDGTYDKIQNVLERMDLANVTVVDGISVTEPWAASVFGDYQALNQYDAVFVNCGVSETEFLGAPDPVVAANLRQYVQQGGSLYISDQAYDIVELVWPERVDFLFADSEPSAAELGADGSYTLEVAEPGLASFVGADEITIDFSFGYFALINEVAPGTTVYLRGDVRYHVNGGIETLENTPVTVGFTDGAPGVGGRVIFSTFHQETDLDGESEVLDGPEDAVLRYLVFEL